MQIVLQSSKFGSSIFILPSETSLAYRAAMIPQSWHNSEG